MKARAVDARQLLPKNLKRNYVDRSDHINLCTSIYGILAIVHQAKVK